MAERERVQLNLRLDGYKELYEAVKQAANEQDTSVNTFVINALKAALGWETDEPKASAAAPSIEAILEAVRSELDIILDSKLVEFRSEIEERLGKLKARSREGR